MTAELKGGPELVFLEAPGLGFLGLGALREDELEPVAGRQMMQYAVWMAIRGMRLCVSEEVGEATREEKRR